MMNYLNKVIGGRYEMQEIIGVGGMAVVYKALDRIENRTVAVKILKDQYLTNEEFRQRFKNESKAIAVMSHPNIVKVYDVNFGEDLLYIVMEHIEGINLKEYIVRKGNLAWKDALLIVAQILRALQHAHDKGIIHRDIKPQNILLLQNGTIKVTDFGIARFNRGDVKAKEDTSAIGSVHYVSPEQIRGEYTDAKSDVYSVGIVLYEMLTGGVPFDAKDANDIAVMHLQKDAIRPTVLNGDIPVGLEQITMRAMQKNPKDRYQSAAEMLLDLDVLKRDPLIKFDYTYFVDKDPTKYLSVSAQPLPVAQVSDFAAPSQPVIDDQAQQTVEDEPAEDEMITDDDDDEYEFRGRNLTVPLLSVLSALLVAVVGFVMLMVFYDPLAGYFSDNEDSKIGKVFSYLSEKFGAEEIEVPNFMNMTFDEVKAKYPNIKFENPVYVLNSEFEAGRICAQTPKAAATMTKDTVVKLTIARSATSQIAIPDVVGKNYMTAKSELSAYGFTVVLMPVFAENETIGNVIRTDPVAGTMLETLKKVTVYYASSINTSVVSVPNVVGSLKSVAEQKIRAQGLVASVSYEASSASLKGYVISQSPVADSDYKVALGSAVNIVVGTGVDSANSVSFSITLPNTGKTGIVYLYVNDEYYDSYDGQKFDGSKFVMGVSGSGTENMFKIYADDTLIYAGDIDFTVEPAKISISYRSEMTEKKISVPNVVGKTKTAAVDAMTAAGFKNVTVKEIESPDAAGMVVSQSPVASDYAQYDKSTAITIYVSLGTQLEDPSVQVVEPSSAAPIIPTPTEPESTTQQATEPQSTTQTTEPPTDAPPVFEPEDTTQGDVIIF